MADDSEVKELLNQKNWQDERRRLRDILLDCGLEERVKWGKLCYAWEDSNVAIIYGMKNSCAVGFFKGSLLEDEGGVLVQPGKHSQAMRRLHFESLAEIEGSEDTIDDDPELAEAFEELTPGRQRGWVLHFSDAKQSETRTRRIEKTRSKIIAGKGRNER